MITLTENKIDLKPIIKWLKTEPRLTKGNLTIEFEKRFSEYIGSKYSVFVNSGSSANLAMIYSLLLRLKISRYKNKIIVPAICWSTTISPIIQLCQEPIICDVDIGTLGYNIEKLKYLIEKEKPIAVLAVSVLGFPIDERIKNICKEHETILLEDSCETIGRINGAIITHSFYYGHHMTTIEGGMISTNDDILYTILKMIRSHGWDRDLDHEEQKTLRDKAKVDDFQSLYTFYFPGFNIRSTDLQAKIGLEQVDTLQEIENKRKENYNRYNDVLKQWDYKDVSAMGYPVLSDKRADIVKILQENDIECRPLIAGNIGRHPAFKSTKPLPNADKVHEQGFYVPCHPGLTAKEIEKVCEIICGR